MLTDYDMPGANGQGLPTSLEPVAPPAPTGPRDEKRITWLHLPAPYEGVQVQVWINPPNKFMDIMNAGGRPETMAALRRLANDDEHAEERWLLQEQARQEQYEVLGRMVLAHNGWLDYDGHPYPPANTRAFWDEISQEAALMILALYQDEQQRAPLAMRKKRK